MSENTVSRVFLKVYKILVTFSNKIVFKTTTRSTALIFYTLESV